MYLQYSKFILKSSLQNKKIQDNILTTMKIKLVHQLEEKEKRREIYLI